MMEAKDTVMDATTRRQFRILITKPRFDYWDIERALELQAEISFKAGRREVVETYKRENPDSYNKYQSWWQAQLKAWGIR